MSSLTFPPYLLSADNLGTLSLRRAETLKHMTADLLLTGNFRDLEDAKQQLRHDGYWLIEVEILAEEAVNDCWQEVIAQEMSEDLVHLATADGSLSNGHPGYGGSASC